MILFFILCYKIYPIIFTITIIFCRHVTNVTNVTSRYKISPIIFTITIIFFRHVTNITNVTSHYKISPILGCRAPVGVIMKHLLFFFSSIMKNILSFCPTSSFFLPKKYSSPFFISKPRKL